MAAERQASPLGRLHANRRAAPQATAAYTEITTDAIAEAIANVSDHSHDGNLHDHAYQVGGSVVSDPVSTVTSTVTPTLRLPLPSPLPLPLEACPGEAGSNVCASCPHLRLLLDYSRSATRGRPRTRRPLHTAHGSARLLTERPRSQRCAASAALSRRIRSAHRRPR